MNKLQLKSDKNNVELVIRGMNVPKKIKTKIVKVPLAVANHSSVIFAIVVPEITVQMKCVNLQKIVEIFMEKKYTMADPLLNNSDGDIADVNLIMGSDATKLLCPVTKVLGSRPNDSAYMESSLGVLLSGDPCMLLSNLQFLPTLPNTLDNAHDQSSQYCNQTWDSSRVSSMRVDTSHTECHNCTVNEVLDERGKLISLKLQQATEEMLDQLTVQYMNSDSEDGQDICSNLNNDPITEVMENSYRKEDGRLVMPLPWNIQCKDKLGVNFNLSRKILEGNMKKLIKDNKMDAYDAVFKEQEKLGIIERIEDVEGYMTKNPDCSFLPHTGVFKMDRETTKVRILYLSNLCEKSPDRPEAVSHNNALLPGPCLNSKLSTSLLQARFDETILIFDISKAFLGIELTESDQNKLLCLWYKNVAENDFSLIIYKNLRLSFGLRPSPTIITLALYKILI